MLFRSCDHLTKFRDYLNKCQRNIKFSFEEEKNGKLYFLDVKVSRERNEFVTTVYRKPAFSGIYTYFDSILLFEIWHDLYFGFQIFFNLFEQDYLSK